MKRFALLLSIVLTCISLFASTAEAKRFGGGSSFGKQRTMSTPVQRSPAAAPAPVTPAQPIAAPQPSGNRWLGPLAGLAIGAGLGALFAGSGMGGGMGAMLAIVLAVLAVMFLITIFARKQQPMQYAGAGAPYAGGTPEPVQQAVASAPATPVAAANVPADFPVESFLRSVKTSFIRLQAANDRKDLDDIREYTTPEVFAEISMQVKERDNTPQKTDVVSVGAELLEVVTENDHTIASVRVTGVLVENTGPAENFDEIWHMQKDLKDEKSIWLLSGIQQV
jgi:predicted lipid-binding transport protein (Tim44 family)